MQELWVENDYDYSQYVEYINENKVTVHVLNSGNDFVTINAGGLIVNLSKKYTTPKYNPLIFGKNHTEYIVNVSITENGAKIYKADGTVSHIDYVPWYITSKPDRSSTRLKGEQHYKYLKHVPFSEYINLERDFSRWTPRSIEEGFMILHGYTYFKGMKFNEVSVLSFDIEATTLDPKNKDAQVVLISTTFRDKTGKLHKYLFQEKDKSKEAEMIQSWADLVLNLNPDIIIGHNIMSYDLPYISSRVKGKLALGRDGEYINFDEEISRYRKDGTQSYDYHNATIAGREIVDTFFLSIKYDIGRQFPSYGLKQIEKHLNLVGKDRIEWDFTLNPVSKTLKDTELWDKFCKYCSDDSDSPIKMWDIMAPSFFYMTQAIPKTFQQVINQATGSQLDSIMIRSYLQDGWSQPKSSPKEEYEGAISLGVPGVYTNVRKVDVSSLYPSIMLHYKIADKKKDPNSNLLTVLDYFRTDRLKNKKLAKDTGDRYYDDLQASEKILINSIYGFLGAGYLLYNYPKGAADVTRYGRDILNTSVVWATGHNLKRVVKDITNEGKENEKENYEWVLGDKVSEGKGFTLVNSDTDSISYAGSTGNFKDEVNELNSLYPDLIKFEEDGEFSKVIVVRAKNYVLVDMKGKVKIKGSSITDQKKEPILTKFLKESIDSLLSDNKDLSSLYNQYCREAMHITNIKDWCVKKTVTKSLLHPERANEQKPADAIAEAIKHKVIAGIQEGDKIYLYQAVDGEKQKMTKGQPEVYKKTGLPVMVPNTVLRYPELWKNDHDVWHYVERVYKTLCILENVIDMDNIVKYHLKSNRSQLSDQTN